MLRRLFLVIAQWMYGVLMNLRYVHIVKVDPEGDGNTASLVHACGQSFQSGNMFEPVKSMIEAPDLR